MGRARICACDPAERRRAPPASFPASSSRQASEGDSVFLATSQRSLSNQGRDGREITEPETRLHPGGILGRQDVTRGPQAAAARDGGAKDAFLSVIPACTSALSRAAGWFFSQHVRGAFTDCSRCRDVSAGSVRVPQGCAVLTPHTAPADLRVQPPIPGGGQRPTRPWSPPAVAVCSPHMAGVLDSAPRHASRGALLGLQS